MEIRKREVSFDKWAKWAIQQDMQALAQPVSSITATSTADQIAQAKEMDTPVKFQGGKRLGSKSMGRWRRYSDATTIKDALQAGATPSDMRNDFEKGLMVIENFQTPEPIRGSGNMRYTESVQFTFHTVNCRFRDCASLYARAFARASPAVTKTVQKLRSPASILWARSRA